MGNVFICHASRDQEFVDRMIPALESSGIRAIRGGAGDWTSERWQADRVEAIDTAEGVVLFLTRDSTTRRSVLKTAVLARETGAACVVPVLLEQLDLSGEWLQALAGAEPVRYFEDPPGAFRQIVARLNRRAGELRQKPPVQHRRHEVEMVLRNVTREQFYEPVREALLGSLAAIAGGSAAGYLVTRVESGSLHVFVRMPQRDRYALQAQALNADARIARAGITALRFSKNGRFLSAGEFLDRPVPAAETFVETPAPVAAATWVEPPPAPPAAPPVTPSARKRRSPLSCVLLVLVGLGLLCAAVFAGLFVLNGLVPGLDLPQAWLPANVEASASPTAPPPAATASPEPSATPSPAPTATATATPAPTHTPTASPSPTAAFTATPSLTVTPDQLTVAASSQAFCRYGPGTAFLPNVDIFQGDVMAVEGRYQYGSWLWVRPEKVDRSCWIAASLVQPAVDINAVPVVDYKIIMPIVTDIAPPSNVAAVRNGNQVTITWDAINVSPGGERGYLLDLFVCQGGAYLKYITHTDNTSIVITDEGGCAGPSGGDLYGAAATGYTMPVALNWP